MLKDILMGNLLPQFNLTIKQFNAFNKPKNI
jgi:hypothetical protein